MNTERQSIIAEARNRLARAEAAVSAAFDVTPEALTAPIQSWQAHYPQLCAAIRCAADLKGWLHVFLDRGECRLPMPEALE
jgi:hypothetical protein